MSKHRFIADNTIPGLGASDLARLIGGTYVTGIEALAGGSREGKPGVLKRAFRGAYREVLRDLGLNRDAC
ncbi:MAG: hypothetical protein V3S40_06405 [Kiloniellales bacterium]